MPLALAQDNVGVADRPRPEYDAQGIPIGAFVFRPLLGLSSEFNDNVLATASNPLDDWVFRLEPRLSLSSITADGDGDGLALETYGRISRYADAISENTDEYGGGAHGILTVLTGTELRGGLEFSHSALSRQSELSPLEALHPIEYNAGAANVTAAHDFGEWRLAARFDWQRFAYQNGIDRAGNAIFEKFLNYDVTTETLRADYGVSPDTSLFIAGQWSDTGYDEKPPLTQFNRKADGFEITGGVHLHATEVIEGDVSIGYLQADYPHIAGQNLSELAAHAALSWYPTRITSVTLRFDRTVRESALQLSAGYLDTGGSLLIDHELRHNVILDAHLDYSHAAYQGVDRNDDVWRAGFGAKYLISNQMNLALDFDHEARASSGAQRFADFDANRITLSLNLQL